MSFQDEIRLTITNKIIESLKKDQRPWSKPWSLDPNFGPARNIVSKKRYHGINVLILAVGALDQDFKSKWWGTYKQWTEMGGQVKKRPANVKKGEWGTTIVYYHIIEKDVTDAQGNTKKDKIFILRSYTVFNLDQVEGEKLDKFRVKEQIPVVAPQFFACEPVEKIIEATGAKFTFGGNAAFYSRPVGLFPKHSGGDKIYMPKQSQFADQAEFYITQYHELAHWAEVRLKWTGPKAMGELVAEMTACFLADETAVPNRSLVNHTKYLAEWIQCMESDPKWIFRAAAQASKVADFILSFSKAKEEKESELPEDAKEADDENAG